MTLRRLDSSQPSCDSCPEKGQVDAETQSHINAVVDWLVSQIEHVLRHPLLGKLARNKMGEMFHSFEARLRQMNLDPENIGLILHQTYVRIKKIVER